MRRRGWLALALALLLGALALSSWPPAVGVAPRCPVLRPSGRTKMALRCSRRARTPRPPSSRPRGAGSSPGFPRRATRSRARRRTSWPGAGSFTTSTARRMPSRTAGSSTPSMERGPRCPRRRARRPMERRSSAWSGAEPRPHRARRGPPPCPSTAPRSSSGSRMEELRSSSKPAGSVRSCCASRTRSHGPSSTAWTCSSGQRSGACSVPSAACASARTRAHRAPGRPRRVRAHRARLGPGAGLRLGLDGGPARPRRRIRARAARVRHAQGGGQRHQRTAQPVLSTARHGLRANRLQGILYDQQLVADAGFELDSIPAGAYLATIEVGHAYRYPRILDEREVLLQAGHHQHVKFDVASFPRPALVEVRGVLVVPVEWDLGDMGLYLELVGEPTLDGVVQRYLDQSEMDVLDPGLAYLRLVLRRAAARILRGALSTPSERASRSRLPPRAGSTSRSRRRRRSRSPS